MTEFRPEQFGTPLEPLSEPIAISPSSERLDSKLRITEAECVYKALTQGEGELEYTFRAGVDPDMQTATIHLTETGEVTIVPQEFEGILEHSMPFNRYRNALVNTIAIAQASRSLYPGEAEFKIFIATIFDEQLHKTTPASLAAQPPESHPLVQDIAEQATKEVPEEAREYTTGQFDPGLLLNSLMNGDVVKFSLPYTIPGSSPTRTIGLPGRLFPNGDGEILPSPYSQDPQAQKQFERFATMLFESMRLIEVHYEDFKASPPMVQKALCEMATSITQKKLGNH